MEQGSTKPREGATLARVSIVDVEMLKSRLGLNRNSF